MMRAYERFLQYAAIYTASDEESPTTPTTQRQFDLANKLVRELQAMGIENARVDEQCYVYATIPATKGREKKPGLGFVAHMDTAPDFCGEHVKPQIIEYYNGEEIALGNSGRKLTPARFGHLSKLKGRTLITTDGTTLLGADDKAGIAEIMTMAQRITSGDMPHSKICIAFTPDEEVGSGADHFDVAGFGAAYAYTVDGGPEGEIEYENFNACDARFDVKGFNVHPGDAKDKMVNASLVAMEINNMLPAADVPSRTEGYEGFYHLCSMKGDIAAAELDYIVRDHSKEIFEARKQTMRHIEKVLNEKYGAGTVTLTIKDQYENMKEKIEPAFHLIENARKAIEQAGLTPITNPVRGGTDGARLSYMGLPCPNLGTGGYAYHGPYEHITAEGMDLATDVLMNIIALYA